VCENKTTRLYAEYGAILKKPFGRMTKFEVFQILFWVWDVEDPQNNSMLCKRKKEATLSTNVLEERSGTNTPLSKYTHSGGEEHTHIIQHTHTHTHTHTHISILWYTPFGGKMPLRPKPVEFPKISFTSVNG